MNHWSLLMDPEKPKTRETLPTLSEEDSKVFAQRGKEYSETISGAGNGLKTDLHQASNKLVAATGQIVDAINVAIGAILDQNTQQKIHHENERMMMGILESQIRATQKDNERTRQLIWATIILSTIFVLSQFYMISRIQAVMSHQRDSLQSTSVLFNKLFEVVSSIEETQKNVKDFVEQKATIAIRPTDKKGSASIEVKQPVTMGDGKIEYDVVRFPVNLKGAEVRPPIHEEAIREKSSVADKVGEALK
jgi:hypothetical protein